MEATDRPSVSVLTRREEVALKAAKKKKEEEDNFTFKPKINKNLKAKNEDIENSREGENAKDPFEKLYVEGMKMKEKARSRTRSRSRTPSRYDERSQTSSLSTAGPKFGPGPDLKRSSSVGRSREKSPSVGGRSRYSGGNLSSSPSRGRLRSHSVGDQSGTSVCSAMTMGSEFTMDDPFGDISDFASEFGMSTVVVPMVPVPMKRTAPVPKEREQPKPLEIAQRLNKMATVSSSAKINHPPSSPLHSAPSTPQSSPDRGAPLPTGVPCPSMATVAGGALPVTPVTFPTMSKPLSASVSATVERLCHGNTLSSTAKMRAAGPSPLVPEYRGTHTSKKNRSRSDTKMDSILACMSSESIIGLGEGRPGCSSIDMSLSVMDLSAVSSESVSLSLSLSMFKGGSESPMHVNQHAVEITERLSKHSTMSSIAKHIVNKPPKAMEELPQHIPGNRKFPTSSIDSYHLGSTSSDVSVSSFSVHSSQSIHSVLSVTKTKSSAEKKREKAIMSPSIHEHPIQINGAAPRRTDVLLYRSRSGGMNGTMSHSMGSISMGSLDDGHQRYNPVPVPVRTTRPSPSHALAVSGGGGGGGGGGGAYTGGGPSAVSGGGDRGTEAPSEAPFPSPLLDPTPATTTTTTTTTPATLTTTAPRLSSRGRSPLVPESLRGTPLTLRDYEVSGEEEAPEGVFTSLAPLPLKDHAQEGLAMRPEMVEEMSPSLEDSSAVVEFIVEKRGDREDSEIPSVEREGEGEGEGEGGEVRKTPSEGSSKKKRPSLTGHSGLIGVRNTSFRSIEEYKEEGYANHTPSHTIHTCEDILDMSSYDSLGEMNFRCRSVEGTPSPSKGLSSLHDTHTVGNPVVNLTCTTTTSSPSQSVTLYPIPPIPPIHPIPPLMRVVPLIPESTSTKLLYPNTRSPNISRNTSSILATMSFESVSGLNSNSSSSLSVDLDRLTEHSKAYSHSKSYNSGSGYGSGSE